MKKLFLCCAALSAALSVCAGPLYCRSGVVLCAEFSRSKPDGFRRLGAEEPVKNPVYAAVTIKLDKGRKVDIADYSLRAGGRVYECVAVRNNSSGRFTEASDGGQKRRCTLFFELDASAVGRGGKVVLVCNAPGRGEVVPRFANLGSKDFTRDSAIPEPNAEKPGK